MPQRAQRDNSLDERGLRRFDPDGHALYWHYAAAGVDYSRDGLSGAICTEGHVYDQDAATGRYARPGRLRRRVGESPLLTGVGQVLGLWLLKPGAPHSWVVKVTCRRGDLFDSVPEWPNRLIGADEFVAMLLTPLLAHGWTFEPRIECPEHRAERETVEHALAALRQQSIQELFASAAPGTPAPATTAPPVGGLRGALRHVRTLTGGRNAARA